MVRQKKPPRSGGDFFEIHSIMLCAQRSWSRKPYRLFWPRTLCNLFLLCSFYTRFLLYRPFLRNSRSCCMQMWNYRLRTGRLLQYSSFFSWCDSYKVIYHCCYVLVVQRSRTLQIAETFLFHEGAGGPPGRLFCAFRVSSTGYWA